MYGKVISGTIVKTMKCNRVILFFNDMVLHYTTIYNTTSYVVLEWSDTGIQTTNNPAQDKYDANDAQTDSFLRSSLQL